MQFLKLVFPPLLQNAPCEPSLVVTGKKKNAAYGEERVTESVISVSFALSNL